MREPGGPAQQPQTMEQMTHILATELGPEIPVQLTARGFDEQVVSVNMPEGGTYVRREADGSLNYRVGCMSNGLGVTFDRKTETIEVTQGQLGCRIARSYNASGTTDIVTVSATPDEVRGRVRQALPSGDRSGLQESTGRILDTTEINGRSVAEVEDGLRDRTFGWAPNNRLGRNESLIEALATANEHVVGSGYTHEQLAEPLFFMLDQYVHGSHEPGQLAEYNGRTYRIEGDNGRQPDKSAISGKSEWIMLIRVVDVETDATLQFDALNPTEIKEHGFYGGTGEGVTRHVSPGAIATVFNLRPQNS